MSQNVTLLSLRTQARDRADQANSQFVSDTLLNNYINSSARELYDLLITSFKDYYVTSSTINVTSGVDTYALPSDFYKLLGVDLVLANNSLPNQAITLRPFMFQERNNYVFTPTWNVVGLSYLRYRLLGQNIRFVPAPNSTETVKLWYVPTLPALSADNDTLDGVSGWEEFVVIDSAIKLMQKEESDCSVLMAQKQAMIQRINDSVDNRDAAFPDKVTDTTKTLPYEFWLFSENI